MSEQVPEGWNRIPLGDLFKIEIGGTPSRNNVAFWDATKESGNIWVSIRDLSQKYITDTKEYISDSGVQNSNVKLIPEGTVIMSFKLTIGRTAFAAKNLYTNEAIAAFIHKNPNIVDTEYFYQGLQFWNLLENVDRAVKGATLNKEKLNRIDGTFPPLQEQNKIAKILTSVDSVIEKTEAQINKLQSLKKGMMQELLTKGIGHTEFKDSPVGRIPKEWEVKRLGDLISSMSGGVSVNSENKPKLSGEYGVLKTSAVSKGQFFPSENKVILKSEHKRAKINPKIDSIIISRMNTLALVGESGYIDGNYLDLFLPDRLWQIEVNDRNFTNVKWLSFILTNSDTRRAISYAATGTSGSMKNISKPNLLSIKIPFPTKKEQDLISTAISQVGSTIKTQQKRLQKEQQLKKALMQDLLTGKVRVKVN
jgi:type I restriction enzyme, S subunit